MTLRSLFTAGALVSMGVLLSRVLGLLREMLLASRFGVGPEADMAVGLLIIPDFIIGALAGTAVSATFVPLFTARGREDALQIFWQALTLSIGVFTLLAIVIGLNSGGIAHFFTKDTNILPGAGFAFLIAISTIPLTAATAIITAYLQYIGRFTVPAFANAIFNGVIVLMLWVMPIGLSLLAAGIFLGVLVRFLSNAYAFYRNGNRFLPQFWQPWQINRPIVKRYLTTVATDICNLMPQFAPYYLIAMMGSGVAIFNYAFRLSVMPAMIGFNVTQMVILPWFSRLKLDANEDKVPQYSLTLQCAWALCLSCSLSLMLASHEVVQLCFGYGKMDAADIDQISHLFALGVWSMAPILLTCIWQQLLYAHGQPRMPFVSSSIQALIILPLCWVGNQLFGLGGAMAAYAFLQVISVALLSWAGYKQGIIAHYRPSMVYAKMALVAVVVWTPLALLYRSVTWAAGYKILLAIMIGMLLLIAAISMCAPVRHWALKKMRKI